MGKTKEAQVKYKCRLCNKIYSDTSCGADFGMATMLMFDILNDTDYTVGKMIGMKPKKITQHCCNDNQIGVADFIGINLI